MFIVVDICVILLVQHPVLLRVTIPRFLFRKPIPILVHDFHEVDTINLSPSDMLVTPALANWNATFLWLVFDQGWTALLFRAFSGTVEKQSGIASEAAGHRLGKPE